MFTKKFAYALIPEFEFFCFYIYFLFFWQWNGEKAFRKRESDGTIVLQGLLANCKRETLSHSAAAVVCLCKKPAFRSKIFTGDIHMSAGMKRRVG